MRITTKTGLRRSAALVLSAAGLASAAVLAPAASASAAVPASTHQTHVAHLAHLHHLHVLHVFHATQAAALEDAASRSADRAPLSDGTATLSDYSPGSVKAYAQTLVPADQWDSFNSIITHESDWDYTATNGSSGAYGLPQALPGSKMGSVASDWRTNPVTQLKWGLDYMNTTYGSPNAAWVFWQNHNWY
jgi:hypothetical protein